MNAVVRWSISMALGLAVGTAVPIDTVSSGALRAAEAFAADWAEGSLLEIKGLDTSSGQEGRSGRRSIAVDKVELVMQGGPTLRLAPTVMIRRDDAVISLEELPAQSRIRYSPSTGPVTEIMLLEMLAR